MTASDAETGLPPALVTEIDALLDRQFGLDALWLFGSLAAGAGRPDSDLDLAALFRRAPGGLELIEAREYLAALSGRAVDLVDLDRASPILMLQVLKHGRLLVDRDPRHRVRFAASVPGRYEDLKIIRREAERSLLERVRRGRA